MNQRSHLFVDYFVVRYCVFLVTCLAVPLSVGAQPTEKRLIWKSIYSGVRRLVQQQDTRSGLWETGRGKEQDLRATGLALLGLMECGLFHLGGTNANDSAKKAVRRGLYALCRMQSKSGRFGSDQGRICYTDVICSAALFTAYYETRDPRILRAVRRTRSYLRTVQRRDGAWSFAEEGPGDAALTALCVFALYRDEPNNDERRATARKWLLNTIDADTLTARHDPVMRGSAPVLVPETPLAKIAATFHVDQLGSDRSPTEPRVAGLLTKSPVTKWTGLDLAYAFWGTQVMTVWAWGRDLPTERKKWRHSLERTLSSAQADDTSIAARGDPHSPSCSNRLWSLVVPVRPRCTFVPLWRT